MALETSLSGQVKIGDHQGRAGSENGERAPACEMFPLEMLGAHPPLPWALP